MPACGCSGIPFIQPVVRIFGFQLGQECVVGDEFLGKGTPWTHGKLHS